MKSSPFNIVMSLCSLKNLPISCLNFDIDMLVVHKQLYTTELMRRSSPAYIITRFQFYFVMVIERSALLFIIRNYLPTRQ